MRVLSITALVVAMLAVSITVQAQESTPCAPSQLREGRLVPRETDTGLVFSGEAGDFISEPFVLPESNVIYESDYRDEGHSSAVLEEAPGSQASGGGLAGSVLGGTVIEERGILRVYEPGEFILVVHADHPWTVWLEY
jgi:hypothetical protein